MPPFRIREGGRDDLPGIAELYLETGLDRDMTVDRYTAWWEWLLLQKPSAPGKTTVGVDAAGRIIAHGAMVPFRFLLGGESRMGGALCQLMVSKQFRKELAFLRLETAILRDYHTAGMEFAYGLVTIPPLLKAHVGLGFRAAGALPVYARPYKLARVAAQALKSPAAAAALRPLLVAAGRIARMRFSRRPTSPTVVEVPQLDADADRFLSRVQGHFRCHAARSSALLNWRFARSPLRTYRIFVARDRDAAEGYCVISRIRMRDFDCMAVVDIMFSPERRDVGAALLNRVHEEAVASDVDMSACMLNPHSPLLRSFRRWGYFKTPECFTFIIHEPRGAPRPIHGEFPFSQWHLTWFDHDYV
jgi:hypothetical protein